MCTTVMVIGRVGEEIRDWTLESIPVATPHRECAGLLVATANTQGDGEGEGSTGVGEQLLSLSVKKV